METFLPENLRYLLKQRGMTAAELAQLLSVSNQAVSAWLNPSNDVLPNLANLLILSNIFGYSIDDLLKKDLQTGEELDQENNEITRIERAINELERLRNTLRGRKNPRSLMTLPSIRRRLYRGHPSPPKEYCLI